MKELRGCSISGSFGDLEIPLPLLFFYLFNNVELDFTVHFLALRFFYELIQFEDIVRWGVWLGRHICKKITQVS